MTEIINPIDLFGSLTLNPNGQIKKLWDIQKEVLSFYFSNLVKSKRVAIELPTGSGKSIVSLLILEAWRRAGKRVAILTSSVALSYDMQNRCNDLGISNTVIIGAKRAADEGEEESRARIRGIKEYKRCNCIGIMNYWAYMMGRDIASPDVLVIDDADSFENLLIDQHSVVVSKDDDPAIYDYLRQGLVQHRIYQRLELMDSFSNPEDVLLIYFPHSIEMASRLKKVVVQKGRSFVSEDLFWSLERNRDSVETYLMFASGREFTFTPYIVCGSMDEKIRSIDHVIYTSATLGSPERIHRTMGSFIDIVILAEKDLKSQVGTMGTRVIFPLSEISNAGKIDSKTLEAVTKIVDSFGKALVLCNSRSDAKKIITYLLDHGKRATQYQKESDSADFMKQSEGALVAAGRFMGLDLPSKYCSVAIVTRMPDVFGPIDSLIKNILEDNQYSDEKLSHRLVQSFGRCNRQPDDRAIYFMLDSRLASDILGDEEVYQHFPRRMKAELDYGQEFAEIGGLAKTIETGKLILSNKMGDVEKEISSRSGRESADHGTAIAAKASTYMTEIKGWHDLTERRSYLEAATCFLDCISQYKKGPSSKRIDRQIAWLNYQVASCYYLGYIFFQNESYKKEAVSYLKESIKSGYTSWFSGLQVIVNELSETKPEEKVIFDIENQSYKESLLRKWIDFYSINSIGKKNPLEAWDRMRQVIVSGTHDAMCDNLEDILELMGFDVSVVGKEPGKPDLILFSNVGTKYVSIIEVKTKDTSNVIKRDDVDQIGGHRVYYQKRYPDRPVYPLIFTNKSEISPEAIEKARDNVRILRSSEFTTIMLKYIELMQKGWKIDDPSERLSFMMNIPSLDKFEVLFKTAKDPLVTLEDASSIL
jgi:hypothetical protein